MKVNEPGDVDTEAYDDETIQNDTYEDVDSNEGEVINLGFQRSTQSNLKVNKTRRCQSLKQLLVDLTTSDAVCFCNHSRNKRYLVERSKVLRPAQTAPIDEESPSL